MSPRPVAFRDVSTPPFLDLPAGVQALSLDTPRGALAALAASPAGGGGQSRAPVLLVPGYTGSKEDFIAVLAPIAAAGHPVAAIDLRGQFESPGADDPSGYEVAALAEDVLAVAAGMGAPVHLVGHSLGGLVARAAALSAPKSLRSLTLMCSGPAAVPPPANANIGLMAQALPVMDLETIWLAKRQIEAETELEPPPPEIEAFLHKRFVSNQPAGLLRMAETLLSETDRTAQLADVDLPMLVTYGERDDVWPPDLQAEMGKRLGAKIVVIRDGAHSPAAQQPERTAEALVAFWADLG